MRGVFHFPHNAAMSKNSAVPLAAAAAFGYECAALCSGGRLPTITALCSQRRWLGAVAVSALIVHLAAARPRITVTIEPAVSSS